MKALKIVLFGLLALVAIVVILGFIAIKETIAIDEDLSALLIEYYGDYSGTGSAHEAMETYIKAKGIDAAIPAIEQYVTDSTTEPDPNKWLTRIYYPLKS